MITNQANPESRHYFDWNNRRWYAPTYLLLRDFREFFKIEAKINPIRDGQNNSKLNN
jgi:hypothetical protein